MRHVHSDFVFPDAVFLFVESLSQVLVLVLSHSNTLFLCKELVPGFVDFYFYFSSLEVQFSTQRRPFRVRVLTYLQKHVSSTLVQYYYDVRVRTHTTHNKNKR